MDRIEELRKAKAEAIKSAKAINDVAEAEKRELTEDEAAKVDDLLTEAERLEADVQAAEKAQQRSARLAANVADLDRSRGRKTEPDTTDVTVGKDLREDDPTGGFGDFGELARAVQAACHPGHMVIDPRLQILNAAYGQAEYGGEEGGFFVGTDYSTKLYERVMEALDIIGKCDRVVIGGSSNSLEVTASVDHDRSSTTYRYGGVVPYWVGEAKQITRSNLKARKIRLELNKVGAIAFCTEEELSDANVQFGARLLSKFGEAIGDELAEKLMFGTGAGQPQGALNAACCLSQAKETGQDADTIVAENVIKMQSRIWANSTGKVYWYYNQECIPQLMTMSLAVGTGGALVYLPPGGLTGTMAASIFGRPAMVTEHCEALGDAGDIAVVDWSQYLFASKGTIKTAMSIHLRFDYDETAFKATYRVDGRPVWETYMTPRKGAATVSPFIKLAARA